VKKFEGCVIGKARQANVVKKSSHLIAENAGKRFFLYIASVKDKDLFLKISVKNRIGNLQDI
jgi:hypothetical protein